LWPLSVNREGKRDRVLRGEVSPFNRSLPIANRFTTARRMIIPDAPAKITFPPDDLVHSCAENGTESLDTKEQQPWRAAKKTSEPAQPTVTPHPAGASRAISSKRSSKSITAPAGLAGACI